MEEDEFEADCRCDNCGYIGDYSKFRYELDPEGDDLECPICHGEDCEVVF
jgi:Zn finger protein HypA/HybF involved in hydrogenase expression